MRYEVKYCFIPMRMFLRSQCVPVGYQVVTYIRAYKMNVETRSFEDAPLRSRGRNAKPLVRWEMSTTPKAKVNEDILLSPPGDAAFRLSNVVDRRPTVEFRECPHREKYSVSRKFIILPAN